MARLQPKSSRGKKAPVTRAYGKITVTLRLFPETKRALAEAARAQGTNGSDYVEDTLLARLTTEGYL